jgi:flavin-dependent dehydrogenase
VPKAAVSGLVTRNESVIGVETARGQLNADLVIDASGKASKLQQWMAGLGYKLPEPALIDGLVGYATQIFKATPEQNRDWRALYVQAAPGKPQGLRGGSIFPIENGQWHVTVAGFAKDYPPTNTEGFLEYTRGFHSPDIYNAIREAEPVGGVFGSRSTENRHLHLERAAAWPRGFLVVGDSAVHLNPAYGQGMTLAALTGEALEQCLAAGDDRLSQRFHGALNRVVQGPWVLATTVDLQSPERLGDPAPAGFPLVRSYMEQLMKVVSHYRPAARRFAEVLQLMRSPNSLVAPHILVPTLAGAFKRPVDHRAARQATT